MNQSVEHDLNFSCVALLHALFVVQQSSERANE